MAKAKTKSTAVVPVPELPTGPKGMKWALIREDFITQNLTRVDGPSYTLAELAAAHHVSYSMTRKMASKQGWNDLLKARREAVHAEAVQQLHGVAVFDEIEIRTRQAGYARLAQTIAHKKLNGLTDKQIAKLSTKDAIDLMKLGLAEERVALGLGDALPKPPTPPGGTALTETQVFQVARRVIELKRGGHGGNGTDR